MDSKDIIIIILAAVIIALVIAGASSLSPKSENATAEDNITVVNNTTIARISSDIADNSNASDNDSDIVSEEIVFNAQQGEGYFREVTYKDGGFRQFDLETGDLIGSSYDSDQKNLPTME